MMKKSLLIVSAIALVATIVSSCTGKDAIIGKRDEISGAGAVVPEPFYLMVFDAYQTSSGNIVNYGDVGSKAGILKLQKKVVDFAGSDEMLSDEQMAKMKPVVHIPTCLVAVVFSYNIPGVSKLNLTGDVVADIYAGKITRWNDPRIKALNRRAKLPAKDIVPIFRSDASCINYLLTSYLSAVSDDWKTTYGAAKTVKFPVGSATVCNADVATILAETPYSIGYMGSEYAFTLKLPIARLRNANGEMITPTIESITAAAVGDTLPDTCISLVNSPSKGAYPISFYTWLIVYKEQKYNNHTKKQARATVNLLQYILSDSTQQSAMDINFAPLPQYVIDNNRKKIKKITYNGRPILR